MALSERTQTGINLATGIITVIIQFAVGFFLSPFIVKNLGTEANGFSQLANNFVMYASLLTMAFNSMGGRFVSVSFHRGHIEEARSYYTTICVINIAMIALLLPLAVYVVHNLEGIVRIDSADPVDLKLLFSFVFLNFFFNLVSSLFSIGLFVKNQVFLTNIINAVKVLLNALLLLTFFSLLDPRLYFISVTSATLTLAMIPVYANVQKRIIPELNFQRGLFSWKSVKNLFTSGIWNTVNQAGHLLNTGLDLLLANLFISPLSMGLLSVSKTVPTALTQIANTINNNFSPSITKSWASEDKKKFIGELRTSMKVSSIMVSIPIVTFCCFSIQFYSLWQPSLDAKVLATLSILACMPMIPLAGTQALYNVFTAANKLRVNSISFIVTGFLNIMVVYLYLKGGGSRGVYMIAGVSSLLSIIRNLVVNLPYVSRILDLKWYEFYKDVGVSIVCCLINCLLFMAVARLGLDGWTGLIIEVMMVGILSLIAESFLLLKKETRERLVMSFIQRFSQNN